MRVQVVVRTPARVTVEFLVLVFCSQHQTHLELVHNNVKYMNLNVGTASHHVVCGSCWQWAESCPWRDPTGRGGGGASLHGPAGLRQAQVIPLLILQTATDKWLPVSLQSKNGDWGCTITSLITSLTYGVAPPCPMFWRCDETEDSWTNCWSHDHGNASSIASGLSGTPTPTQNTPILQIQLYRKT